MIRRFDGPTGTPPAMGDDPNPTTTTELKAIQADRSDDAAERAAEAEHDAERRAHERRSEKAAYLRDKLAEAERAEGDEPADRVTPSS